ncbi:nucleotide-diphospho-sugar transferase [Cutaneotrichosporon oleaginosum]|uniref:UDP-N-acetylglucosamine diphosphorylase n=1 Tax=Cutaneotrichosporon oleaginosum TaxID=879819 RepID=A0A0J0XVU9_9TREE|nr:nucleotide-diphospho-sugar transferase [Cutaneotrichosporon oleaginosum]KLT45207.1 nucleotide-diphospho-sugar transferase [Cutaneotrichosporon oleaginosum]TXT14957.1 hypothetical protein COLE_01150 [Cutaneotrichosporon oleaginosum]
MTHSNGHANPNGGPDLAALRQAYEEAGQGHVFTFWDKLTPAEQGPFAAELASIDVKRVNRIYRNAMAAEAPAADLTGLAPPLVGKDISRSPSPTPEEAGPLPASAVASSDSPDAARWRDVGLRAIADGTVAVLLLAGGQGSRLGSPNPKGMYDLGLPSSKSLFAYQAGRIRKLQALAAQHAGKDDKDVRLRWYVMTSGPTRAVTEAYFAEMDYFGLDSNDVVFFEQGVLPALSNDGKLLLAAPGKVFTAPDGNGGLYAALRRPVNANTDMTVLSDLHARGIKYIHAYCVDNCLVKVADPVFVGYCIERDAQCGAKVVRKTVPTESVGVIAKRGEAYGVIEYSELPTAKAEQRDDKGDLAFWAANIANHFYTTAFLDTVEAMERKMAFHIARKKIPHVDIASGQQLSPAEPNGMKLEMFIFDVFPFVPALSVLEVSRAEEFSGLKNAPGSKSDSPETSRRDLLAQQRRWLLAAGATFADGVEVEVTPEASYGGEGLEYVAGKHFVRSGAISGPDDVAALV